MEALQKVRPTLRELDIRLEIYSDFAEEVEDLSIWPFPGQLGSLREFSRLRKLRAPIVMLLGWSPGELPLRLAITQTSERHEPRLTRGPPLKA